MMDLIFKIY